MTKEEFEKQIATMQERNKQMDTCDKAMTEIRETVAFMNEMEKQKGGIE